ncbi:tetratricopeptide repeat protein [Aquirufa sp.]|jgi:tetratricopeptide (TPR) repeat protein|uniref:tetratricopeptide repeat protein n=1 Tax=Aquirufa sp. TaxID=2676249 RepID=UPI0037C18406
MKTRYLILLLLASFAAHSAALDSLAKEAKYLPLYGQKALSQKDQTELTQFVESCDASFGSRKEASDFFVERAWEYVGAGKLDTATYRFNLLHALNDQSVDAYWGLGVITFQRNDFPKAIEFLEKGLSLDTAQAILRVDLAVVQLSCYLKQMECGTLDGVEGHLAIALRQQPGYGMAWMKRAQVAYLQERYAEAWTYLHTSRKLDISQLDISLGQLLAEKMPDPEGIFK